MQDAEEDVSTAQGARLVQDEAVPQLSRLPNGVNDGGVQQRPEQAPVTQHAQQAHQMRQLVPVDYDSLPKPSPYPLEGDIIAYRLLHIGADWTPQVTPILWSRGTSHQDAGPAPKIDCPHLPPSTAPSLLRSVTLPLPSLCMLDFSMHHSLGAFCPDSAPCVHGTIAGDFVHFGLQILCRPASHRYTGAACCKSA